MLDFLFGCLVTAAGFLAYQHFAGTTPGKPGSPSESPWETALFARIEKMITDAANTIIAAIQALPAKFDTSAALEAEKADHADDLNAISQAVSAITPPDQPAG